VTARLKIIYTGGTFGMQAGKQGLTPAGGLDRRLRVALKESALPHHALTGISWKVHENPVLLDSANIGPTDWETLARQCREMQDIDAIVIIHGTDTLAYSACALAFFLQATRIPVVLTGSQLPLGTAKSDALDNISGAMQHAANGRPGVWVYFDRQYMPAARVVKKDALSFRGFSAPRAGPDSVDAVNHLSIDWQPVPRKWSAVQIASAHMVPGYSVNQLIALISSQPNAIILSLYGRGTFPDRNQALMQALIRARQQGILLVAVSQCYIASIDLSIYATGTGLGRIGVLSGRDITFEAAYAKLMVLYRLGYPPEEIERLADSSKDAVIALGFLL